MDHQFGPSLRPDKGARDRLITRAAQHPDWVLGFQDECCWSRVTDPNLHAWGGAEPLRLVEKTVPKGERKALSCYGVWLPQARQMLLRFVEGRPVSGLTVAFREWVSTCLHQAGQRALLMIWDNASWHVSEEVRSWLRAHNRQVKQGEKKGVRLIGCRLPSKSPWLNSMEPKWLHGKRAVAEPGTVLAEAELMARVHEHFGCPAHPLLSTILS